MNKLCIAVLAVVYGTITFLGTGGLHSLFRLHHSHGCLLGSQPTSSRTAGSEDAVHPGTDRQRGHAYQEHSEFTPRTALQKQNTPADSRIPHSCDNCRVCQLFSFVKVALVSHVQESAQSLTAEQSIPAPRFVARLLFSSVFSRGPPLL